MPYKTEPSFFYLWIIKTTPEDPSRPIVELVASRHCQHEMDALGWASSESHVNLVDCYVVSDEQGNMWNLGEFQSTEYERGPYESYRPAWEHDDIEWRDDTPDGLISVCGEYRVKTTEKGWSSFYQDQILVENVSIDTAYKAAEQHQLENRS